MSSPGGVVRPPKGAAKRKSSPLNFIPGGPLSAFGCSAGGPPILHNVSPVSPSLGESELQLYRVLQRANLLSYYDTFIAQGGDDVQQLIEAGEEEFLEIMALVGMSSKPLHVRRLQKALQEWVKTPGLFAMPPFGALAGFTSPLRGSGSSILNGASSTVTPSPPPPASTGLVVSPIPVHSVSSPPHQNGASAPSSPGSRGEQGLLLPVSSPLSGSNSPTNSQAGGGSSLEYPPSSTSPTPHNNPVLSEYQIQKISQTADLIVKSFPTPFEPKLPSKKKFNKELEIKNYVTSMSDEDPRKMEEIRKFSAIYGRFDCKRRPQKPLTLHEVSVNEAAAQLCAKLPALLVRRDELFPLARQVVRDSGYQYSKGHSRSQFSTGFPSKLFGGCVSSVADKTKPASSEAKRLKTDDSDIKSKDVWDEEAGISNETKDETGVSSEYPVRRLSSINQEIQALRSKQAEMLNQHQGGDYSGFLSYNSRSGASSEGDKTDDESLGVDPLVQSSSSPSSNLVSNVLSSSGGQIIAVQNPALFIRNREEGGGSLVASSSSSSSLPHLSIPISDSPPKRRRKSSKVITSPLGNGGSLHHHV